MRTIIRIIFLACAILCAVTGCAPAPQHIATCLGVNRFCLERPVLKKECTDFLLYLPPGYDPAGPPQPLLLFLHGRSERGEDPALVQRHGPPRMIAETCGPFPFIMVAPQCPAEEVWYSADQIENLIALLDYITRNYNVDPDRVYGTGISMGGAGIWSLAMADPGRFAAILPISGFGIPERAAEIKRIPAWIVHGVRDHVVPVRDSEDMAAALKEAGGDVRLDILPDAGHDAWTVTYRNPEVWQWLLAHTRKNP